MTQVQDVDISTAHWAQFTFRKPRKSAFIRPLPATIFFSTKKSDDFTDYSSNHRTFIKKQVYRAFYFYINEVLQENS
jgi:hypothetical protein